MFDRNDGRARAQGSLRVRGTASSFVRPGLRLGALLACGIVATGLAGCQRQQANANVARGDAAASPAPPGAPAASPSLLLAPEDLVTLRSSAFAVGPPITGSIQPERAADL